VIPGRRLQPLLLKPEKAHRKLSQVIAVVTGRQLAGSPERVGGVPSKGRYLHIQSAGHGNPHDGKWDSSMLGCEKSARLSGS
jgi:hypothetical protein